jgi:hypothetical protein
MKTIILIVMGLIAASAVFVAWIAGIAIPVLLVTWIVGITSFWQLVTAVVVWPASLFLAGFFAMLVEAIGD